MTMARNTAPSFVLTRRLITTESDAAYIDKKMRIVERLYNTGGKHCLKLLEEVKADYWYQHSLMMYKAAKDTDAQKVWAGEIFLVAAAYGLTEYDIHAYLGKGKVNAYTNGIGINIVQKAGTALYSGVKKALFGKKLHYRKYNSTESFEDKKANTGIIYHPQKGTVSVMGREIRLKQCRESDRYMQEALLHKIKYCRIVRRPFGQSYRYFVQFVMEGSSPEKIRPGNGTLGVDPGVSTMTAYSGKALHFVELSKNVDKHTKRILHLQRVYDHRMRVNNPDCYNEDGTFKKGSRIHRTKGMLRTMMKLKAAFRKRSTYVRQSNGYETNRLIEAGTALIVEPMTYRNLARRSKTIERQDKVSTVTDRQGNTKQVRKYKRRRRFGQSILIHSPAAFVEQLKTKALKYGGTYEIVNTGSFRASQYDHATDKYEKHELSERYKTVGGHVVQRDCYSSFLIYHKKDPDHVDRVQCEKDFSNFLKCQDALLELGITNSNFGLTKSLAA